MRRTITILAIAAITLGLTVVLPALADDQHGRPTCTAPPMDETSFGSRDGFDHNHLIDPDVAGSLVELEGFLNVCRTNDSTVIEGASGSSRVVLVAGVKRVGTRALLEQWNGTAWVTKADSGATNTGVNRTLTVTTPFHVAPTLAPGWTRVTLRALVRSSDDGLNFYIRHTPAIWVDDGPVTLPIPS